jgi:hypothetical protein
MLHWHPVVLKVIARDHIEDLHDLSNKNENHNRGF